MKLAWGITECQELVYIIFDWDLEVKIFFIFFNSCMDTTCSLNFKPEKIVLIVLILLMKIHSLTLEFIENVQFILIILCKQVKIFFKLLSLT